MSLGFTPDHIAEQEALKRIYAASGGNCPGVCAEGHRIRGRNAVRYGTKDICRKCVESGLITIESRRPTRQSVVYFVGDDQGYVKIGYAACADGRLRDLQVAHATELKLLLAIPGGPDLERELHRRFGVDRVRGEWFRLSPSIIKYISESQVSA